jgi:DNA (cytosine-5)-methyltransferase 1
LSLGWLNASSRRGTQLLAAVDADSTLEEVYAYNYHGTSFIPHTFGDAFDKDESKILANRARLSPDDIEVLLAAPPCQTFSAAGKRELDSNSRLVYHVCDFASLMRPKIILIENVPEFSRAYDGRLLGRVKVRLTEAGYITEVVHVSAASFGVPQMRMRGFTLAIRKDLKWPGREHLIQQLDLLDKQNFIPEAPSTQDVGEILHSSASAPTTVAEAIDDLPPLEAGAGEQETDLTTSPNSAYQILLRKQEKRLYNHVAPQHSLEMIEAMSQLRPGETPQETPGHRLRRKDYFRGAYARLDPKLPAMTITTQTQNPGSGRFTHYRDHRVITVREVARLQSFPDRFRFFGSQAVQRRHVGNAVPPLLAQALASVLLPLLDS